MGSIIFSDYRLVYNFVDHCQKDIADLKCGRVQLEDEDDVSISIIKLLKFFIKKKFEFRKNKFSVHVFITTNCNILFY